MTSIFLEPNADYVLSLAASNEMGVSPIVYQMASTRDHNINTLETNNLIPPIGLKANVISPNSIEVSWTDNSLLDFDVLHFTLNWNFFYYALVNFYNLLQPNVNDERLYIVRYNAYAPGNEKYKYTNTTDLSCIVNDLKPNTLYEFTVKLVKVR